MKIPIQIRVEPRELDSWKACAEKSGLNLSEWIRRRCNGWGELIETEKIMREKGFAPDAGSDHQDGTGVRELPVARRGAGVTDTAPRSAARFSEIELEVARRTGHEPGCKCEFVCGASLRFLTASAPKEEPAPKKKRR